eukprot:2268659-Rhodomonas_salina.2
MSSTIGLAVPVNEAIGSVNGPSRQNLVPSYRHGLASPAGTSTETNASPYVAKSNAIDRSSGSIVQRRRIGISDFAAELD